MIAPFKTILSQLYRPKDKSWHISFISALSKHTEQNCYLEVGIYEASTFNTVCREFKQALAIDINAAAESFISKSAKASSEVTFLEGDLSSHENKLQNYAGDISLAFIDADHRIDALTNDLSIVLPLLSKQGLALAHDTFPPTPEMAADQYCSNSYLIGNVIREVFPEFTFGTIPISPGLTIIHRKALLPQWLSSENLR